MASSDPYQPVFENADLNLSSLLNSSLLKLGENESFNCSFNNSLLLTPDVSSQPSPGRLNTSTPTQKETPATLDQLKQLIGPYPCEAPEGMVWIPQWTLVAKENLNTSFEEIFLNCVKPLAPKQPKKRIKLNLKTQVRIRFFRIYYLSVLLTMDKFQSMDG